MALVDVLLATYNGAEYLADLLDSLEQQTFKGWRLVVRDDGSSDDSVSIVERWTHRHCTDCLILRDDRDGLGAAENFGALLEASDAPYFMCCDQDDVWLPEKIAKLLQIIRQREAERGSQIPLLVHSDLIVTDSKLRPVHQSLRAYMHIATPPKDRLLNQLLVQASVVGCASIGNAALRRTASPIPRDCVMHDWWLALVAGALGEIVEVAQPTVLYRQHDRNTLGARTWALPAVVRRVLLDPRASLHRTGSMLERTQSQARALADRFASQLDAETTALVHGYGHIQASHLWRRKLFMIRNRMWGRNVWASIGLLVMA